MIFGLEPEGGSLIAPMALVHPLHPIDNRSRNKRWSLRVGWCVSSWWPWFPSRSSVLIYIYIHICIYIYAFLIWVLLYDTYIYMYTTGVSFSIGEAAPHHVLKDCISGECAVPGRNATFCFSWFTHCVLLFDNSLILGCLWPLVFVLKQHFDTRYLVFYNPSPPRMFLSLDFLSEYRIQYGTNGPLYFTSSYSTWIFCRGVSGSAIDCPCGVWCRGLTTCLLHVGQPFGNRILNSSWAVGLT